MNRHEIDTVWSKPVPARELIFQALDEFREAGPEDDTSHRFGPIVAMEMQKFIGAVTHFAEKRDLTRGAEAGLHVASSDAKKAQLESSFYRLPSIDLSYLTYSALNSRGNIVVAEQLNVFDNDNSPSTPSTVITRCNMRRPGSTYSSMTPINLGGHDPIVLKGIHDRIIEGTEELTSEQRTGRAILQLIKSAPDELA